MFKLVSASWIWTDSVALCIQNGISCVLWYYSISYLNNEERSAREMFYFIPNAVASLRVYIIRQIVCSIPRKIALSIANVLDIDTKRRPVCSASPWPLRRSNFISLDVIELPYLPVQQVTLLAVRASWRINYMVEKANSINNDSHSCSRISTLIQNLHFLLQHPWWLVRK